MERRRRKGQQLRQQRLQRTRRRKRKTRRTSGRRREVAQLRMLQPVRLAVRLPQLWSLGRLEAVTQRAVALQPPLLPRAQTLGRPSKAETERRWMRPREARRRKRRRRIRRPAAVPQLPPVGKPLRRLLHR